MATMRDEKCPVCHRLKSSGGTASITQWINTCVCNLAATADSIEIPCKEVCLDCGKEIGTARKGSLTQFVFRPDYCSCQRPRTRLTRSNDFYVGPDGVSAEEFDGVEIDVEEDSFPRLRYAPVRIIGEGASGKIYLAWDRQLHKFVAVKVLNILSPAALLAFQGEARATSKLVHPWVVRVFDFGVTAGGGPYMVLDYFPGESLRTTLEREGSISWRHASNIILRVCSTLSYCHGLGIYHGDLKPENILIMPGAGDNPDLKLVDFGLAKFVSRCIDEGAPELAGTPVYMCPDILRSFNYDASAEVYSLGCIFFELLTGRLPYHSSGDTAIGQINLHVSTATPRVSEYLLDSAAIPEALDALVFRAMHKNREERFKSMEELASELESIFQEDRDFDELACKGNVDIGTNMVDRGAPKVSWPTPWSLALALAGFLLAGVAAFFWLGSGQPLQQAKDGQNSVLQKRPRSRMYTDLFTETLEDKAGASRMVTGKVNILDEDLAVFRRGLKGDKPVYLNLQGQRLTGKGFRYLAGLPIYRLNCTGCKLDDRSSRHLSRVKTLSMLHLSSAGITDVFIDNLGASQELRWLSFGQNPGITGSCLARLSRFPSLTNIILSATTIDDAALMHLNSLKNLEEIVLNSMPGISSRGIESLRRLPRLKYLEVIDCKKLDRQSLLSISMMPGLHRLRFGVNVGFEPEDLLVLDQSPQLNSISIHNLCPIKRYLPFLLQLDRIREYDFIGTDITDSDLVLFQGAKHMERLKIEMSPNVSIGAIKRLKAGFSHPVEFKTDVADTASKFGAIDELLNSEEF